MPAGKATLSWDGRLESGEAAPDGVYGTTIRARDPAGREGPPASGRLTVFRGVPAAVRGAARAGTARVTVSSKHGSARTLADEDGSFALYGLAPGEETLVYSARGFFPEERPIRLEEGAEVDVPDVALSNCALRSVTADPPVIRPGAGGDEPEEVSLRLVFDRACEARVEVLDRTGRPVRVLLDGPVMAGEQGLSWAGDDDRGRPRSGVHTVRITALAGGERVIQGEASVLVDRGLVTFARAVPRILSPDADGFDDVTAVTLSLADDAKVTVTVADAAGAVVRELARDEQVPAGWFAREWDGRDAGGGVLPEGVYRVLVESSYLTGEKSRPASAEAVLDLSPPRFLSIEPENGSTLPSGRPTIRARLERVGDLDPSSLMVKIDEYSVPPDDYDAATGWLTYTPKTSLGEGVHIALVYARDLAENMAMPEATSFTVKAGEPDRTRPRAEFASPGEGATVYTARPSVEALLRDDGAGVDPESIRGSILALKNPNLVLSCSKDFYEFLKKEAFFGLSDIPCKPYTPWKGGYPIEKISSQGRIIASPVAFTSMAFQTIPYNHPQSSSLLVATSIMENTHLHQKIREEGGAYGTGASYSPTTGNFYLYTYRDPHLANSLLAFETSIEELGKGHFNDEDLTEAKLEIIQAIDSPIPPGKRAFTAYGWKRVGKTKEMRDAFRKKVLTAKKEEIVEAVKQHLLSQKDKGIIVSFADVDFLKKENELLKKSLPILQV